MPRKIKDVTKDYLVNVSLPNHGQTYTVISHQSIIDYAYAELANQGFGIVDEEYRSTLDGQIAQGIYKLQYGTDPEMNLMFAWTNSYNKQIRFKCATGGYVTTNRTVMLAGEMGSYARKHTGTADADVIASMQAQITNAMMYYNQLVSDKEVMKTIELSTRKQAELLGILFAEYEILTTEQASTIRQQMDKPSYFYNGGKNTLWAFYNHCTVALQQSHPRTWMEDQRMLHWVISNEYDLTTPATANALVALVEEPVVDPLLNNYGEPENQTNLLTQIAEVTGDESVLAAQYPPTPNDTFMSAEVIVMDLGDPESTPEPLQDYIERTAVEEVDHVIVEDEIWTTDEEPQKIATILDEVVSYEDPAGNTFEAPVVTVDEVQLNETTKQAVVVADINTFDNDFDLSFDDTEEDTDSMSSDDFFL